jgi:polar amino acid transport system permease protein
MSIFTVSPGEKTHFAKVAANFLLSCGIVVGAFWLILSLVGYAFDFAALSGLQARWRQGFLMTVYLSVASLVVSLLIGLAVAVLQNSKILILRYLAGLYVAFIRGTPLIMQIFLFYYIVADAFHLENRFIAGVLILSIFEGAYIAEIIRGSLLSLENSQLEAAKAVGFTGKQTVAYVLLPQMIARTLPALTGQFASIIKDSSLLSMIAQTELMQTTREITAMNFKFVEAYLLLGALYLCLNLPITVISQESERRFNYDN